MNRTPPLHGYLQEWDVASLLFYFHQAKIEGMLNLTLDPCQWKIFVENGKILGSILSPEPTPLSEYLCSKGQFPDHLHPLLTSTRQENQSSMIRTVLETGEVSMDRLWGAMKHREKERIFPLFTHTAGRFQILADTELPNTPPLSLDIDIPAFLLEGIRAITDESFIRNRLPISQELMHTGKASDTLFPLEPYETYILRLAKSSSVLEEIVSRSELPPFITQRTVYLLSILGFIKGKSDIQTFKIKEMEKTWIPAFQSFEEALDYFNSLFEYTYRLLSKQIGPVAFSILQEAVLSIKDQFPSYMNQLQMLENGRIEEKSILKSVYFLEFEQHISPFLLGLEEILYAEIYTVKKHLGKEYEQMILQWIRENNAV